MRNFQLIFSASHVDPAAIVEASHVFQSRVLCNNPEYKGLVMNLALPLAANHEPLMHAWISSTLLFMSGNGDSAQMREESVIHYNHAVRELKTSVLEGDLSAEWKRATVMLCHAIELLQPIPSPCWLARILRPLITCFKRQLDSPACHKTIMTDSSSKHISFGPLQTAYSSKISTGNCHSTT